MADPASVLAHSRDLGATPAHSPAGAVRWSPSPPACHCLTLTGCRCLSAPAPRCLALPCCPVALSPLQSIIRSYRQACQLAVSKVKELSVSLDGKGDAEKRELLVKCAATSLNSKLVSA